MYFPVYLRITLFYFELTELFRPKAIEIKAFFFIYITILFFLKKIDGYPCMKSWSGVTVTGLKYTKKF